MCESGREILHGKCSSESENKWAEELCTHFIVFYNWLRGPLERDATSRSFACYVHNQDDATFPAVFRLREVSLEYFEKLPCLGFPDADSQGIGTSRSVRRRSHEEPVPDRISRGPRTRLGPCCILEGMIALKSDCTG